MTSTSLTLRRQKFVSEYVETGNATQAATLAGYSPRTAYSQGSRVVTFVEVQQAIETERQTLRVRVRIPPSPPNFMLGPYARERCGRARLLIHYL